MDNLFKINKDTNLDYKSLKDGIVKWLKEYAESSGAKGFAIGVSGGVDSAVVSAICAKTGLPLLVLEMPIHQDKDQVTRATNHIKWLKDNFKNVKSKKIDLSESYDVLYNVYLEDGGGHEHPEETFNFSMANTRARLRMTTLYQFAGMHKMLVVGTGNKVEDFGIGFFTKYGDGAVDISPIADLMKSEVRGLGCELGVSEEIINAVPTDGLHSDSRTDEEQIGATYDELEWAMEWVSSHLLGIEDTIKNRELPFYSKEACEPELTDRQYDVLGIYWKFNTSNKHKMNPIPVFDTSKFRQ